MPVKVGVKACNKTMLSTIVKRVLQGILVIFCVLVLTFVLLRLIPGDPVRSLAGNAPKETVEALRESMGLNDSIPEQFVKYMKGIFQGNLGYSFFQKNDVSYVIGNCVNKTLQMVVMAVPSAIVVGLLFGLLSAVFLGTWFDKLINMIAVLCQSMPIYWVAVMAIQLICVKYKLLPASGYQNIRYAILPAICLALPLAGVLIRNVRTSMAGSLQMNFVKAAHARGLSGFVVLMGYAFRNVLVPTLTLVGSQLGFVVGNCLVLENLFAYPGLGMQCLNAILRRDYFLVQGLVVVLSAFFIIINMIIDISYAYLDPRIRKAEGGL